MTAGLANQNCAWPVERAATRRFFTSFNPGDTSWTCTASGYYTFTGRGSGGTGSSNAGGSAAAAQVTELIFNGQVVTFVIGKGGVSGGNINGVDTVITFPSGRVVTIGGGKSETNGSAGGVATNGDLNISGNVGSGGVGTPAPAIGNFPAVTPGAVNGQAYGPGTGGAGGTPGSAAGAGIIYLQAGKP